MLYNIVVVFVIHWHESAMDLHVFPIPIPPPTSLSTRSLWLFPVHQVRAFNLLYCKGKKWDWFKWIQWRGLRSLTLTLGIKVQRAQSHPFHDASDTPTGSLTFTSSPTPEFSGSQEKKVVLLCFEGITWHQESLQGFSWLPMGLSLESLH